MPPAGFFSPTSPSGQSIRSPFMSGFDYDRTIHHSFLNYNKKPMQREGQQLPPLRLAPEGKRQSFLQLKEPSDEKAFPFDGPPSLFANSSFQHEPPAPCENTCTVNHVPLFTPPEQSSENLFQPLQAPTGLNEITSAAVDESGKPKLEVWRLYCRNLGVCDQWLYCGFCCYHDKCPLSSTHLGDIKLGREKLFHKTEMCRNGQACGRAKSNSCGFWHPERGERRATAQGNISSHLARVQERRNQLGMLPRCN